MMMLDGVRGGALPTHHTNTHTRTHKNHLRINTKGLFIYLATWVLSGAAGDQTATTLSIFTVIVGKIKETMLLYSFKTAGLWSSWKPVERQQKMYEADSVSSFVQ